MTFTRFTLAYWCVLMAALLPLACSLIAKAGTYGIPRKQGGFDNHNPRAWLARQVDWRARANAAQANSFEALPLFIGAVLIAHQLGAHQARLDILAFMFVFLRIIYVMAYVADQAKLRSVIWSVAFAVNLGILFIGYR